MSKNGVIISWILTIIFALLIIYECWQIFELGHYSATNFILLIVAFVLTFVCSTAARIKKQK